MKISKQYLAVVVATILGVVAMWCSRRQAPRWRECAGIVWTTEYHISYLAQSDLSDSIQLVLQAVDRSASVYNEASTIAAINAGTSMRSDAILDTLYHASVLVHRESGGAFDPTVMPLVNVWGFGRTHGTSPSDEQIDSLLQFVGLEKLKLRDGSFVKADARVQLDFSSIAKGLACDEIGRMLNRNGVSDYMVEIGGEVTLSGSNPQGKPWHVSVDMPTEQDDEVSHESALVLSLNQGGVATSGNYRKFRDEGGQRLSHIVNPATGRSQTSDLLSVTVVAQSCMMADAWATACMVLGADRVVDMMGSRHDLGVMTISVDGDGRLVVWSNSRFARFIAS